MRSRFELFVQIPCGLELHTVTAFGGIAMNATMSGTGPCSIAESGLAQHAEQLAHIGKRGASA